MSLAMVPFGLHAIGGFHGLHEALSSSMFKLSGEGFEFSPRWIFALTLTWLDWREAALLAVAALAFNLYALPHLARGIYTYRNRKVDPRAIGKTSLLTVEGERDDICGLGQTMAAQDLLSSVKPFRKKHYVQAGVGHYGVFSGTRWQTQIYPIVRNMILANG